MKSMDAGTGHDQSKEVTHEGSEMGKVVSGGDTSSNSLWVYDVVNGAVIAKVAVGMGPTHIIPSADGQSLHVTDTDGDSISIIDTGMWKVVDTITGIPEPYDAELSSDGSMLFVAASGESKLEVVNTENRQVVRSFVVGQKPRGVVVGGDNGKTVFLTNKGDGPLSIIKVETNTAPTTVYVGEGAHALRISPGLETVYIALSKENSVAIFDIGEREVVDKINVGVLPEQIDLSKDGSRLFVSNFEDATVSIINILDRMVVGTVPVGRGAYGLQAVSRSAPRFGALKKNRLGITQVDAASLSSALERKDLRWPMFMCRIQEIFPRPILPSDMIESMTIFPRCPVKTSRS